jgi:hypothetical protein
MVEVEVSGEAGVSDRVPFAVQRCGRAAIEVIETVAAEDWATSAGAISKANTARKERILFNATLQCGRQFRSMMYVG